MTKQQLILATIVALSTSAAAHAGNPAVGKSIFARCSGCHSVAPHINLSGPSLAGIAGRPVASEKFVYSSAMAKSGWTWSDKQLDAFLISPTKALPGTRMPFAGIKDAKQRADLIAYIKALK